MGERGEAERRRAAAEERSVELEERKAAAQEYKMVKEKALKFMFMDTYTLDPNAKAYVELCRDEMIMRKKMLMRNMMGGGMRGGMECAMGGMGGGMGGYMNMMGGAMNAFGGNMGGGFGSNMSGMWLPWQHERNGGGFSGNMSGMGTGFGNKMSMGGGNEGVFGGLCGNETSTHENVDKEAIDDDDHTTIHNDASDNREDEN
nr:glycine-rich RNA-binding protein 5, mitochondrial-like [Aegilops tauschii subsp. strangulata]